MVRGEVAGAGARRRGWAWTVALLTLVALALPPPAAPAATARPSATVRGDDSFNVLIRRTSHGIPHILANDYGSMGYGYGYAIAQDNICVLAETYATVRAERSRFFAPDAIYFSHGNGSKQTNLNSDFFFQRINDRRIIENLLAQPPPVGPLPTIREGVRGYVAGYNRYLADTGVDRIPDPTCRGKPWVKPIQEVDAYRRFYQLGLLASQGVAVDGIAAAAPAVGGSGPSAAGFAELGRRMSALGGLGSNAYGLGRQATGAGGMVLGNPHFPWQGPERFYQTHLTIPGRLDVTGGSLYGVPLVLIGHTDNLAWSHTVSTARRFTIFELKLVPGVPTSYIYDGQVRQMRADRVTVKVPGPGGTLQDQTRTLYSSHHGPVFTSILGLDLFPWTTTTAHAMGDANASNFRYLNHFFETDHAQSTREVDAILRRYEGIPWVNTIAADSGGQAYYADIGTVPNVSNAKANQCSTALGAGTVQSLGVAILDGSRSGCEWDTDSDSVIPGIFGPRNLPSLFRSDYVTNSNDSYWLSNPAQRLEGYARVIGDERTARTLRTRLGLIMVQQRLAGTDGLPGRGFTLDRLQQVAFNNRNYSGELLRNEAVAMCNANPTMRGTDGPVDVRAACPVLAAWNLRDDLDSNGAVLWRRFVSRALASVGGAVSNPTPYTQPFDVNDPVNTPRGLNTANPQVQEAFADAVADLNSAGIPLNAPLRGWQYEKRGAERVPIHGGPHGAGVFNVITAAFRRTGERGFPDVVHGSSFVMAAQVNAGRCPQSRAIMTYSQSSNPASRYAADQSRLYSNKRWLDMLFCEGALLGDPGLSITELGCIAGSGFRSTSFSRRGSGFRFTFSRRSRAPVTIEVFQAARGSSVGSRRLARFRRSSSFTWDGKVRGRRLPDGFYYARYTGLATNGKPEVRTYAFRLLRGRMFRLPSFTRPGNCGLLRTYFLSSPAFGGRRNRSLYAHVKMARAGRATVELFRGSRRVRRIGTFSLRSQRTRAIRINPVGLPGGSYRVKVSVVAGRARTSKGLSARRL
jgi:acyl-homoserine-lactone acylase